MGLVADIEKVLAHYGVDYRRTSAQSMVCCPLHGETNPSMRIRWDDNLFKCFGCGEGGNAMTLIMKMEGCDRERAEQLCASRKLESENADGGGTPIQLASGLGSASSRASRDHRGERKYVRFRRGAQ